MQETFQGSKRPLQAIGNSLVSVPSRYNILLFKEAYENSFKNLKNQ